MQVSTKHRLLKPETQFVVRFMGQRFGITCHSETLDRIFAKTLFTLICEDSQQTNCDLKVFKSILAALNKLYTFGSLNPKLFLASYEDGPYTEQVSKLGDDDSFKFLK